MARRPATVDYLSRRAPAHIVLAIWSVVVLSPLYWVVVTSFKTQIDVATGPKFLPWIDFAPTISAWKDLFQSADAQWMRAFVNSIIVSTASSTIALALSALAGYGLARFEIRLGRLRNRDVAFFFISQRMLPPVALVLPYILFFRFLHLLDTRVGLIIAYVGMGIPLGIWITRDTFSQLPLELEESAMVDGLTRWQAYRKVVLPLAAPGLMAAFLVIFIFSWNEYIVALMLTVQRAQTMPVFIFATNSSLGPQWGAMSAISLVAMAPVVVVGLSLAKYFDRASLAGSFR